MRPRWPAASRVRLLTGVLIAGFNLQLAIVAVGPLIDRIRDDTGMSSAAAGLLQTIPFLCIGCVALSGPRLIARFGAERLAGYALVLLCGGAAVRPAMPSPALLLAGSVPIGIGSGALSLALPAVVKGHYPAKAGAVIGGYAAALSVGAALAALTAVPLANAFGSWRPALAVGAVPAALAVPVWIWAARAHYAPLAEASLGRIAAVRRPPALGLRLAALFACQSVNFTAMISWVAALYRHHGWSGGHAGLTTATISLVTIPAALFLPGLSDGGDRRPWLVATALALGAGTFGIALAPTASPWVWLVIFGVGTGAIYPLCLSLPLDLAAGPREAAELTAWMLGAGYLVSAGSPTVVGGLRDLTGDFRLPMVLLGCIALLAIALASSGAFRPAAAQAPVAATGERAG
jgi:MFS transporter, CP family, cyanate transporter